VGVAFCNNDERRRREGRGGTADAAPSLLALVLVAETAATVAPNAVPDNRLDRRNRDVPGVLGAGVEGLVASASPDKRDFRFNREEVPEKALTAL